MIIVTIYMCSHCTRVHNAAHECEQHEREEHSAAGKSKNRVKSIEEPRPFKRSKPTIYDIEEESDVRDPDAHVDDVQFFANDYTSAIESDVSDDDYAEDPHAAQSSKRRPPRSRQTNEYKLDIINEMKASGYSMRFACKKFDLSRSTLFRWISARAELEDACRNTPMLKTATRGGPRQNDRIDSWRDSVVVAYLQHREAVGDPVKQTLICTIARQVHEAIAKQLGVRSILKSTDNYLNIVRKLMANTPPFTASSTSREMVTWTFENSGALNPDNAQITLPVYEFAAEFKERINAMRHEYREMMQVWNGDLPAPTLPQLPFHYTMAWPLDEEGAPLRDKRTETYDDKTSWPRAKDRKKDGADLSVTVTPETNNIVEAVVEDGVNIAQSWSTFGNGGGTT